MNNIRTVDLTEDSFFAKQDNEINGLSTNIINLSVNSHSFNILYEKKKFIEYGIEYIDVEDKDKLRYAAENPKDFNVEESESWKVKILLWGEYCECCGRKTNNDKGLCDECIKNLNNLENENKMKEMLYRG